MKKTKALTTKQELFVQEYTKDFNATQAAIRAGYSEKTAKQQGSLLLTNVDISERVKNLIEERSKKVGLDADEILAEIKKLAMGDDSVPVSTRLRALEIAGKYFNLWDKEQDQSPRVQIVLTGRDLLT